MEFTNNIIQNGDKNNFKNKSYVMAKIIFGLKGHINSINILTTLVKSEVEFFQNFIFFNAFKK
mgnify:CR=1 FL=1